MKTTRRTFFGALLGWAAAPFIAKAVVPAVPAVGTRYWMGIDMATGPSWTSGVVVERDMDGLVKSIAAMKQFERSAGGIIEKL